MTTRVYTADVLQRLKDLGLELPTELPVPAGCTPPVSTTSWLGVPGRPDAGTRSPGGKGGLEVAVEDGDLAARRAALNALGRIDEALGGSDRFECLVHVAGHVASAEHLVEQPSVLDAASELFVEVLGERGRHTRTAYSSLLLPRDVVVELEITFAYTPN